MKFKEAFLIPLILMFVFVGCKSDGTSPEDNNNSTDQLGFETVDSDLALMKDGGMMLDDAAGVFSIGWNEMFRPFGDTDLVKGMSFAAAFGERETDLTHFRKFGLDMGNVYINFSGNQIQLHKRFHWRRGYAYNLFERPFGVCNPDSMLQFIPNTEYQFEVTGSESFAPITITLTSPNTLMDITSHTNGNIVNPAEDLTIVWTGGELEKKTAIRLMPHRIPDRDPMRPHHPPFDRIITVILNTNPGTFTFSAEQIQRMLLDIDADGMIAEVSQADFGELVHPNGILKTSMRNCSPVMLRLPQ